MTSLAASVAELSLSDLSVVAEGEGEGEGEREAEAGVSPVSPVSEVRPRSVDGYQRCSSLPFRGWRSAWSEGRLRLKNPHL